MRKEIVNGTDPAGGHYHLLKNVTDRALWADRHQTFGNRTYVWDVAFEFLDHQHPRSGCALHAISRVRNDTVRRDYGSDFCNLFNIFGGIDANFTRTMPTDCPEIPPKENMTKICHRLMMEGEESLEMTPEQIAEFVAGIVQGLIGKNDLPEIQHCIQDSSQLEQDIEEAISDFSKGDISDIIKGAQAVGRIIQEFPTALADCKDI